MAADTSHECPAPGCPKSVPSDRLACPAHWYAIPAPVRASLWKEYRDGFGERPYWEARAACLYALGIEPGAIPAINAGVGCRS